MSMLQLRYSVPGDDFTRAGEASGDVKHKLKKLGYNPSAIRRVSIAMYEGEINMVIHAGGGEANVDVDPDKVMQKCELCIENAGGKPACVQGCPNKAIIFEERD